MTRDNFTKETINSLGKRVGFLCSNPNCRRHTTGPHTDSEKVTIIGKAAHIAAAAAGGPRYDATMTTAQRKGIENGIWLCANCADLVDKDWKSFPVKIFKDWKSIAENNMYANLLGSSTKNTTKSPYLEVDLIWIRGSRAPNGYSNKNPVSMFEGRLVREIGSKPIIHWEMTWNYRFVIHNNSSSPALNVKIESTGESHFYNLGKLAKINNIPAFGSIELKAKFIQHIEDYHTVADKIMSKLIPDIGNGLILNLAYYDEERNEHITEIKIINNELENTKIK